MHVLVALFDLLDSAQDVVADDVIPMGDVRMRSRCNLSARVRSSVATAAREDDGRISGHGTLQRDQHPSLMWAERGDRLAIHRR